MKDLFTKHKLARRLTLLWCLCLITYVVVNTMDSAVLLGLTTPAATVIVSFTGILATVIAFYQWHRQQDNKDEDN